MADTDGGQAATETPTPAASMADFDATSITRPDPALMNYYTIVSLLTVVAFPFVFVPLYFKYRTLQYAFDEKGVQMSWGMLFHREIYLTYRRIQDIHVSRNVIQRWLGLATVAVQTASGSSGAEMSIEGIRQPERLRDFLYAKMRGAQDSPSSAAAGEPTDVAEGASGAEATGGQPNADLDAEALVLLKAIRDELRAARSGEEVS
jgi:uncharacterized membrane protein YdbT with pleckstrin-like domain